MGCLKTGCPIYPLVNHHFPIIFIMKWLSYGAQAHSQSHRQEGQLVPASIVVELLLQATKRGFQLVMGLPQARWMVFVENPVISWDDLLPLRRPCGTRAGRVASTSSTAFRGAQAQCPGEIFSDRPNIL